MMQLNASQFQFLQRLGGASILFLALMSVINLIADMLTAPQGTEYLAWLEANQFVWYPNLLSAMASLLAMAGIAAIAVRLEPYQPVWASLLRSWGYTTLLVVALFTLFGGLPFHLVRLTPERAVDLEAVRAAYDMVHTVIWMTHLFLLGILGLMIGMASRTGGLSRIACWLAFGYGSSHLILFLMGPLFGLFGTPVQTVLFAVGPFLQLIWLIWTGVEIIRFADTQQAADSQAA